MNEAKTQDTQRHTFQAEVKQILDIVIHSLYAHREIFVRELISNAVDALERMRVEQLTSESVADPELPLEIRIDVSEAGKTVSVSDTGIGMTEQEIIENLGTIAHSGTREFLERLKDTPSADVQLIGQFGVGFYSSFMAANEVTVQTRSFRSEMPGVEWTSDGGGEYTLRTRDDLQRGTKVILSLRDDAEEFASADRIKEIVKKYSNFIPFPILINGEKVNTVQAIWTRNKSEINDEEYNEFYKFIANAFDEPLYRLHFSSDAPLQIHSLLFVPQMNMEKFGFGKMDPGVNLYCRRVLIQQNSDVILPDWLRFVKGVVDSEDLPLNISRETLQDNALIRKLSSVLTNRFLKYLKEQLKQDRDTYKTFWNTHGMFLKQGVLDDPNHRNEIAPLLFFETSKTESGEPITLSEYLERMKPDQEKIYYIHGPSRDTIQSGPYMEAFLKNDIEVLYLYEPIDDFVFSALREFEGKELVSADQSEIDLPEVEETESSSKEEPALSADDKESLCGWIKEILGDRVDAVRDSKRLVESPAMIVCSDGQMTANIQRIMKATQQEVPSFGRNALEINPSHPIFQRLVEMRKSGDNEDYAKMVVEHIYDSAMADAGLLTDPRAMVKRNYEILEKALSSGPS